MEVAIFLLNYSKYDRVFADYQGNLFSSDQFSDYLYRVSKAGKIKVYAVLLRKAFSFDLYASGVNPVVVKELLGHTYETTSINFYGSSSKKQQADAINNRKFKKN